MKICPITSNIAKVGSNLGPIINEGFENSQRLLKCGKSGEFLPNLVALVVGARYIKLVMMTNEHESSRLFSGVIMTFLTLQIDPNGTNIKYLCPSNVKNYFNRNKRYMR